MVPQPSSVRFAESEDGTKIAYRVRGQGPKLVWARGWVNHLEFSDDDPAIRAFFARLEQHFEVIRYDGRGNGLSDRSLPVNLQLDHIVQDLSAVVDACSPTPVLLWGSSWAGPATIQYASLNPDRVDMLVLDGTFADGSTLTTPERSESFLALLAMADKQPDFVYASMSYMTDPEPGMSHTQRIARTKASIFPEALLKLYTLLYEIDVTPHLENLRCPTLIMHRRGSRSVPLGSARQLASAIPDARLVEFDGRAHNLWEEDPRSVFREIADFFGCPELTASDDASRRARTVSVVFVDQVSSTAQMRELGEERGVEVQSAMIELLRHIAEPFNPDSFADTGDGVQFLVPTATDAIAVAQVIQRRVVTHNETVTPAEHIRLRVGVHTGELLTSESGRASGLVIAYASRLCDLADADEIVSSNITRAEAEAAIGSDDFTELPEVELKGIGRVTPHRVSWLAHG